MKDETLKETPAEAEARKAEEKRLSELTFEERVEEVRKLGFLVGREDATGLSDSVNARQTSPTEAKLTVIKDNYKYTVALDEVSHTNWDLNAEKIGKVLGVKFELEDLQPGNEEDANVKKAMAAAREADGKFVPNK